MDGGTRKRRLESEEEEDSEERKMEKFFALIRSTKEVRDRISKGRENNNKRLEEGKFKNAWNPTFQPEDFIHDHQDSAAGIRSTHLPGPSNDRDVHTPLKGSDPIAEAPPPPAPSPDEEANDEEDKLDLNLSL